MVIELNINKQTHKSFYIFLRLMHSAEFENRLQKTMITEKSSLKLQEGRRRNVRGDEGESHTQNEGKEETCECV